MSSWRGAGGSGGASTSPLTEAWASSGYADSVCMQCMANAMAAVAGATGTRAWLGSRTFGWLTPRRLRAATVTLMAVALIASALLVSGSSSPTHAGGHTGSAASPAR
jgi:hypothetical protein